MSTTPEVVEQWQPPTESLGRVPSVTRGTSCGEPIQGDFPLDQVVIDKLPLGTQVHSCNRHGASDWTVTARIDTTRVDGEPESYFLKVDATLPSTTTQLTRTKCADGDQGKAMLEGEYHSMCALYKVAPTFVPEPLAYGLLNVSNPDSYFFLCAFLDMDTTQPPDPEQLCKKLTTLHLSSASPTGQFGFHMNTCQGNLPQQTAWQDTWKDFFIQLLTGAMKLNRDINGPWKDLQECTDRVITHVVPALLNPLTSNGRVIKPTLIHGDLWDGNIGTDTATGEIYAFDACAYYAHHEMEIAIWRGDPSRILGRQEYTDAYVEIMGKSEPVEGFEDRGRLYCAYMNLHASACHGGDRFREK
ncbi:hypothetical protein J4E90_008781 [Alternaria incomplexa]|uniref:uncharacterized protein n=1 Tax=Alternaria incomplexa TaxID=1187928 RepID=UPI00221FBB1E|nr:uncharacterized protein J4E90_008781 [Alternaria incomplexa]KAI4908157.1 hypothetical protein J4E90_008781 [Alternaria incomplexa]